MTVSTPVLTKAEDGDWFDPTGHRGLESWWVCGDDLARWFEVPGDARLIRIHLEKEELEDTVRLVSRDYGTSARLGLDEKPVFPFSLCKEFLAKHVGTWWVWVEVLD